MPVQVWKKHNSKPNQKLDTCPIAMDTLQVGRVQGEVVISFTSGTVNRASDFEIVISNSSRMKLIELCLEALNLPQKGIHEYSKDELLEAYNDKIKEECGT